MRKLVISAIVLAVLAAGVFAFRHLGTWLSTADPVRPVDLVVVPPGDPDSRVPEALDHLREGRAGELWVAVSSDGPVVSEDEAVEGYARRAGLGDQVDVVGPADTEQGAAVKVGRRLPAVRGDGASLRVAVVTAPWNVARARLTFARVIGPGAEVVAWSDGSPYRADRWWRKHAAVTVLEATKFVGTLALFGARPSSAAEDVPVGLPARALVGGALAAALAGAACRPLARRLGLVAHPRLFRAHAYPVPLMGGVAILVGLGAGVIVGGGFSVGAAGIVAAGGVVTLALVGFVDDLVGLGARSRLLWAALAGGAAWLLGLRAEVFGPGVPGDVVDASLTVLWFAGITHAVNLLDNTDGAAAGVGAVSAAAVSGVALASGQWVVAVGGAALAGACIGYLVHNVHPARLFMGDLGALGVGFALAAMALALRPEQRPPVSFAVAAFVVGVPIFDAVLVTTSRLRSGRRVTTGGTDHPAHRLIARGFSVRGAAAVLWGGQAVLGAAAFAVATSGRAWAWAITVVVVLLGVGTVVLFLRLPPWRPPQGRDVDEVVRAIERAVGPLREVVRTGRTNGLSDADHGTIRVAEDTLTRLERMQRFLEEEQGTRTDGP